MERRSDSRVSTHESFDHPIDHAPSTHLQFELFSVNLQLVHQRLWYVLSCSWECAYKTPLLFIGKSKLCDDWRRPLKKYVRMTTCLTSNAQWYENQSALKVSVNKTSFTFLLLLRVYMLATCQDGYRILTVHTYGECIVLPHWETRPPAPWHDMISHSVTSSCHWANQSLPYPNNAEHQFRKRQVSIFKSLVWLDQGSKSIDMYDQIYITLND